MAVYAEVGATVKRGDVMLTLEAMKMEHPVRAGMDGVVEQINATIGDQCSAKQILGTLKPEPETE